MTDTDPLLSVRNLTTHFHTDEGTVRAVDGVSFDVDRGETVCIVGESGSGKTVTSESITRLVQSPPGEIVDGEVVFDGRDVLGMSESELEDLRGGRIGHVFQNPQGALNPVYTVGWQIIEAIRLHRDVSKAVARERALELLDEVGIPDATTRIDDYPHEFSGGMKQRVVIAMALASNPDLLIADEPTTALDVTIQMQILRLLNRIQEEFGMAIVLITHDLGVVAEVADRVVVMYAGKVMEEGSVYDVFESPSHPYTRALLACLPGRGEMRTIGGAPPSPTDPPSGCRFHPRCSYAVEDCTGGEQPPLVPSGDDPDHTVSCVHFQPGYDPATVLGDAGEEAVADDAVEAGGPEEGATDRMDEPGGPEAGDAVGADGVARADTYDRYGGGSPDDGSGGDVGGDGR